MSDEIQNCVLCENFPINPPCHLSDDDVFRYICHICGNVHINRKSVINLKTSDRKLMHLVSGFTRERTESNLNPIVLFKTTYEEFVETISFPKSITEKFDRILLHLENKSEYPGFKVPIHTSYDRTIAYSKNAEEFIFLRDQLKSKKLVEECEQSTWRLRTEGWNELDAMRRSRKNSNQVFVAT